MKRDVLILDTPEGIVFSLPLAGPVTRFLAWGIDLACIGTAASLLAIALSAYGVVAPDTAQALLAVGYFVLSVGYGIAAEWLWRGQTLGKRLLRLRVVDAQGLRLHPSQIVIRNLLRFVDSLPAFYLVGGVAMLASRHAQRLGDFAANTVVVRLAKQELPDLDQVLAVKYNSLRDHPHLAARLRQRLTPEEAMLPLRALLRRDRLNAPARVALFARLADYYRQIVPFPDEAVHGLADEQYLRNVVDVVFHHKLDANP